MEADVKVIATGDMIVGKGVRAIDAVIREQIVQAQHEIHVVMFSFGKGSKEFFDMLESALQRGVAVNVTVNKLSEQEREVIERLRILRKSYRHFRLVDFSKREGRLHAKVFVFDGKVAVIGSANLTWRGMVKNHELAILVTGQAVSTVMKCITNIY